MNWINCILFAFAFAAIIGLVICISRKNISVGKKESENSSDMLFNLDVKMSDSREKIWSTKIGLNFNSLLLLKVYIFKNSAESGSRAYPQCTLILIINSTFGQNPEAKCS